MKENNEEGDDVYQITQRRQWQPRGQGMNSQFPPLAFNYWNNQLPYGQMNAPPYQDANVWLPTSQKQNHYGQWNPYGRGPQQQLSYQSQHQLNFFQQQFQPPYQQQQLQFPSTTSPNNPPLRPQMHVQPNPNPNNNVIQNIDVHNVLALSITPMPCEEINIRSGTIVEPIVEDAPSS
jgi:hypothetical protein